MLIALGIFLVSIFSGGNSPFVIPKLDKYVKTHVVDDTKKQIVLDVLKEAKAMRKAKMKQKGKDIKKLDKMFSARDASKEEMNALMRSIVDAQSEAQKASIGVHLEAQNNLTAEEWDAIIAEMDKDLEKLIKAHTKIDTKVSKANVKWKDKIEKTIADDDKRAQALESASNLEAVFLENRGIIQEEIMNKNSTLYQYQSPVEELNALQTTFMQLIEEVLQSEIDTHFELVELTTEDEWKKIM